MAKDILWREKKSKRHNAEPMKKKNKAELSTIQRDKDQGGEDNNVRLHGQESFKNRFL